MPQGPNQLRIIGGLWRGRQLGFCPQEGLRPTPNRIRETLFNWLALPIQGARCLDAYGGSGALGFEALSRGATWVTFVDQSKQVAHTLQENLEALKGEGGEVICGDFLTLRPPSSGPFTVVFLDPPFHQHLLEKSLAQLSHPGWLQEDALIYIEYDKNTPPPLSEQWVTLKQKSAGGVGFALLKRSHHA